MVEVIPVDDHVVQGLPVDGHMLQDLQVDGLRHAVLWAVEKHWVFGGVVHLLGGRVLVVLVAAVAVVAVAALLGAVMFDVGQEQEMVLEMEINKNLHVGKTYEQKWVEQMRRTNG